MSVASKNKCQAAVKTAQGTYIDMPDVKGYIVLSLALFHDLMLNGSKMHAYGMKDL